MEQCQQYHERILDTPFKGISPNTQTTSKMAFNNRRDRNKRHCWILENNTPRSIWPIGRVQKVSKGKDNVVRSCLVKTSRGDFVKPAIKLSLISNKSK